LLAQSLREKNIDRIGFLSVEKGRPSPPLSPLVCSPLGAILGDVLLHAELSRQFTQLHFLLPSLVADALQLGELLLEIGAARSVRPAGGASRAGSASRASSPDTQICSSHGQSPSALIRYKRGDAKSQRRFSLHTNKN
jgi:hypothetical protein